MAKSGIEWLKNPKTGKPGFVSNPVKGLCPMNCPYCYARGFYQRFHLYKDGTPNPAWDYTIWFDNEALYKLYNAPSGSKVFVGSTMELFGEWVKPEWLQAIFDHVEGRPDVTYIFLTKRPDRLASWLPLPANVWVGVSATNDVDFTNRAWKHLKDIRATVKFVSFEPLLDWGMSVDDTRFTLESAGIDWVVIGRQTPKNTKTAPEVEWVRGIVEAADKQGVPVFLKDNLASMLPPKYPFMTNPLTTGCYYLRQEFPKVKVTV